MKIRTLFAVSALPLLLAGCGDNVMRNLGLAHDAPDEFQVTTRAPLSMPPDFNTLQQPTPGVRRPQEQSPRDAAEAVLNPQASFDRASGRQGTARASGGEAALLSAAGPNAPADIRSQITRESESLNSADRGLTDRLLFWRDTPQPGTALDAQREAQRLRDNAAQGQPQTTGDTPVIQRENRGLFEGLF